MTRVELERRASRSVLPLKLLSNFFQPMHVISFFAMHILLKCFFNLIGTTIAKINHIFISDILLHTGSDYLLAS